MTAELHDIRRVIRAGVRPFAREIRTLYKRIDALHARLARSHLPGKVAEIRIGDRGTEVRLQLAPEDPQTGKAMLSPWVQIQEAAAASEGGVSTYVPVVIGQPMRLISAHGELGSQSFAVRDGYTDQDPQPDAGGGAAEAVTVTGDAMRRHGPERVRDSLGDGRVVIRPGYVKLKKGGLWVALDGERGEIILSKPPIIDNDPEPQE